MIVEPDTVCTPSAVHTFNNMVVNEVRYFSMDYLQLFRVFEGRLKKDPHNKVRCHISLELDAVRITKLETGDDDDKSTRVKRRVSNS